ncbi:MAG: cytochrome P460 family protein [Flavobacteriales bacterium]|nr:cytochrome P460 family protein [Flavobacteriales bacterium]
MKVNFQKFYFFPFLACFGLTFFQSCDKEEEALKDENFILYQEAVSGNYSMFRNGDLLAGKGPSPHGSFKLRFNDLASSALDSAGNLPVGAKFPQGSILVKDIYSGGNLTLHAIMKKDTTSEFSERGWIWAEYKPNGDIEYNLDRNGQACVFCHGNSPNRDHTRVFDLH